MVATAQVETKEMALDPSIALNAGQGVTPVDIMGNASKGVNLRMLMEQARMQPQVIQQGLDSARASQLATEQATVAATQRQTEEARQLAGSRRAAEITKGHVTVGSDGKVTVNHRAAAAQAAQEGLPTEIVFNNLSKAIQGEADGLKNDSDKEQYLRSNANILTDLLRVQTDPAQAQKLVGAFAAGDERVVGPMAKDFYGARFGADPIAQAKVDSMRTITPEKQVAFGLQGREVSVAETNAATSRLGELRAQDSSFTSPEAKSGGSTFSRNMVDSLKKLGHDVPAGTSAYEIYSNPVWKTVIDSNIPSAGQRVAAKEGAAILGAGADDAEAGLKALGGVRKIAGTKIGSLTIDAYNRLVSQGGDWAALDRSIEGYKLRNPGAPISVVTDGLAGVEAKLMADASKQRKLKEVATSTATSSNLSKDAGKSTRSPGQKIEHSGKTWEYIGPKTEVGSAESKNPKNYREVK